MEFVSAFSFFPLTIEGTLHIYLFFLHIYGRGREGRGKREGMEEKIGRLREEEGGNAGGEREGDKRNGRGMLSWK